MARIKWTEQGHGWLKEIFEYIAQDNPAAAQEVIHGIICRVRMLRRYPRAGYKYRDVPEGEIRILLYGHYRIAYLIQAPDDIAVLGVFHGALDIERYLP